MFLQRVLFFTLVVILTTDVLSMPEEIKQPESHLNQHAKSVGQGNLRRSQRLTKAFGNTGDGVVVKDSISAEERGSISALLSKMSDKAYTYLKLNLWDSVGMLTSYVRKKLGLENLKYGKLARHKNFDGFVSYVDWAESRELSKKAHNHVPTYSVWKDNGLDRVTNVDDLNAIRQTDAFRIYRRYVNILDNLELSTIKAGYGYLYPHKYIGEDGTKMERMARFQIMGEARRPEYYPKEILGLRWASEDQLKKNSNYINYLTTFHKTNEAVKVDNVALIRKNLLET